MLCAFHGVWTLDGCACWRCAAEERDPPPSWRNWWWRFQWDYCVCRAPVTLDFKWCLRCGLLLKGAGLRRVKPHGIAEVRKAA